MSSTCTLSVACDRCKAELWRIDLSDDWGLEPPEGIDELGWLRAASGEEWPARPRGAQSSTIGLPGWHGPNTTRSLPEYTEHEGALTLYFRCGCGATPRRRLARLVGQLAAESLEGRPVVLVTVA